MNNIDVLWEENQIDVTSEANFIWSIANNLRGVYMPDKYADVIIPMTILRRFECTLKNTKDKVVNEYKKNPNLPVQILKSKSGFQFYNVSPFDLKELTNDEKNIKDNFESYIDGFSAEVRDIFKNLDLKAHIKKMDEGGCLYNVVVAFSDLDLDPRTYDSIKMGYIFENLIGRFYQNVDAGQFYTGRDLVRLACSLLISEGCEDIFDQNKVITIVDQAAGTFGMLSTMYTYLKHYNPSIDVKMYGQEYMGPSYSIGLAEMLIKGQDISNFRNADTFKEDCFPNVKMRFAIENPPFGVQFKGKTAKAGQEEAVNKEFKKGLNGRWGAGLPTGDSQLLFMQSAIDKLDKNGRAAIFSNSSPTTYGETTSGDSIIRKWLLENDLVESIIQISTDQFYNISKIEYV